MNISNQLSIFLILSEDMLAFVSQHPEKETVQKRDVNPAVYPFSVALTGNCIPLISIVEPSKLLNLASGKILGTTLLFNVFV
jgi:hypothetical protein